MIRAALLSFVAAFGLSTADAQAWNPFKDSGIGGSGGASAPRAKAPAKSAPATTQSLLISRETDAAMGIAIQQYEGIVAAGGWQPIPKGPKLKAGMRDERVILLRRRLYASGDLQDGSTSPDFDRHVHDAVVRFQTRHGLTPSGEVNRYTRNALNVSAQQRLAQLRLNRQRLRRMLPMTEGRRYILVTIPGYELQAVANGRLELTSRVVTGKPTTPTPEVSASVRAVNFLPYWHVPESIAKRALIPAVKKDPAYLTRENIRVYASWGGAELNPAEINWWAPQGQRLVFRQDPGPFNALGVIRIDMPNRHIVYMHDTPLKKLFKYHLRPYSAGCVRVERVQDLAGWLLGWNPARVAEVVRAGQQQTVKLQQPVPVHFMYLSAWATRDGVVRFRTDVYDKDGDRIRTAKAAEWGTTIRKVEP